MRTAKKSYIDVTKETETKLAHVFNCTPKFVYLALTYARDSETARKIRYTAVSQYGGTAMHHCPKCETMFNITEDHRELMVQHFDNGVKLEADKGTGDVVLYDRTGKEVARWFNVLVSKLSEIQLYAATL